MAALVAWAWQGVALAAAVAGALRLFPRLSATTRHLVWWVALVAVLALPAVPPALNALAPSAGAGSILAASAEPGGWLVLPAVPSSVVAILAGAWLGLVLLGLIRLVRAVARVAQLKRRSRPVPARVRRQLPLWSQACGGGRPAALRVSDQVDSPCALGLGPAVILLPRQLVGVLDPDALDQIVLHEHAHLVRRDDWWRLLQAFIEAIAGAHPAVRWIGRRIEIEREAACDDAVVARTGRPRHYARCLSDVARMSTGAWAPRQPMPAVVPGAIRSASVLRQRVARLVDARRNGSVEPAWVGLAAGVALLVGVVVVLAEAPPVVAFRDGSAGAIPPVEAVARGPATKGLGPSVTPIPAEWAADLVDQASVPEGTAVRRTAGRSRRIPPAGMDVRIGPVPPVLLPAVDGLRAPEEPATVDKSEFLPAVSRFGDLHADAAPYATVSPVSGERPGLSGDGSSWQALADAGAGVGSASKTSGLAVAGFFTRAGRTVAGGF